jgi:A/G-specific adenine glycosylase
MRESSSPRFAQLRRALLSFYRERGRDLPWRRTRDPYAIWVAEVMLQQTQVATVVPRFLELLRRFPNLRALASAEEKTVCEAWAGLGYYGRARNLHKAAVIVAAELDGELPRTEASLRRLPGIGAYTAAAVASIAFGERQAAIDGNVVRVLARVFRLPGRASDRELVQAVRRRARLLVDCDSPGDVNQALMDLGATVCRPEAPDCAACPLRRLCRARRDGNPASYPGRKAKAPRKILRVAFAFIARGPALLLEQRPLPGLWAGLWELPSASGRDAKARLGSRLGQVLGAPVVRVVHALSHRQVVASVYRATARIQPGQKWWRDPLSAPLSALARKAIVAARAEPPLRRRARASP